MYFTLESYANRISELLDLRPKLVYLSSFGVYAGILESGKDVAEYYGPNDCRVLFDRLIANKVKTELLIGISEYFSCRTPDRCDDCERKYIKQLVRLLSHAEKFKAFNWLFATRLHLKCSLFVYDDKIRGLTGGRNLTGSDWDDANFDMTEAQCLDMFTYYKECRKKYDPVNPENIQKVLNRLQND